MQEVNAKTLLEFALHDKNSYNVLDDRFKLIANAYDILGYYVIDIESITNRDEYMTFIALDMLQTCTFNVDVENAVVTCTSVKEFYVCIKAILATIGNEQDYIIIACFVNNIEKYLARTCQYDCINSFASMTI